MSAASTEMRRLTLVAAEAVLRPRAPQKQELAAAEAATRRFHRRLLPDDLFDGLFISRFRRLMSATHQNIFGARLVDAEAALSILVRGARQSMLATAHFAMPRLRRDAPRAK